MKQDDVSKTVITPKEVQKHTINKYNFRGINEILQSSSSVNSTKEPKSQSVNNDDMSSIYQHNVLDHKKLLEVTEAVLKKAEELSTNLKNVEAELKMQKVQFETQLKETKERSYQDGYSAGFNEVKMKFEDETNEIKKRFVDGINSLELSIGETHHTMEALEKELSSIALEIAKEVILVEVSKNSKDIAKELANALIKNVKEATKITLKVNPSDAEYLKENLNEDLKVKIEPNSAIAKGGVVIVSDIGNIDGSVMTRFSNIKASIQEAQTSQEV